MLSTKKKVFIRAFLVIYCLSFLLQQVFYFPSWGVNAEETISNTNIIAIFVDSKLNDGNIKWYASKYIQSRMYDTQALVFPINKDSFKSYDIYKILQNLYMEGEKEGTSRLVGTILVGDLPLPVVKNGGYVFPSVYPYVDLKNPKYPYNKSTGYFETSEDNNGQAEIWHGIINFGDDTQKYENYFHKLKDFSEKPEDFTNDKFWYEDFISLKKYYNSDNLKYYINNFLFFEDIAYHRYTQLIYEIFDADFKNLLYDSSHDYSSDISALKAENDEEMSGADSEFDSLKEISNEYFSKASTFAAQYMNMSTTGTSNYYTQIPTLTLSTILEGYLKTYNNVFGQQYLNDMNNNLAASGRRTEGNFENHIQKIIEKDELIKKLLKNYNDLLEESVDAKIEKDKYAQEIPVPIKYEERDKKKCNKSNDSGSAGSDGGDGGDGGEGGGDAYVNDTKVGAIQLKNPKKDNGVRLASTQNIKLSANDSGDGGEGGGGSCYEVLNGSYENFYFGKYAGDIDTANDFTIYKGKYKNYTGSTQIESYDYDITKLDDVDIDPFNRSIGASYGINDREVMANRGLNYKNATGDAALYVATRCSNSETNELWSYRWRGGGSPLNMDTSNFSNGLKLKAFYYNGAWNPSTNKAIGGRVYDMGGTELKSEDNQYTQTYKGYYKYGAMIKVKKGEDNSDECSSSESNMDYCGSILKDTIGMDEVDYAVAKKKGGNEDVDGKYITIDIDCDGGDGDCCEGGKHKKYYYKLIDSRVKNAYPYPENISGMNIGTMERPVDSSRFITFKGLNRDLVKFVYPNVFDVEVFKKDGDKLILKSVDEIKDSIKDYLKKKSQQYNSYGANFDDNFFVDMLDDENITRLANGLYYLNVPLQKRNSASYNVLDDLTSIEEDFNINSKIKLVLSQYLKTTSSKDQLINPFYNDKAYEAGFINSNGFDVLSSQTLPDIIQQIQSAKNNSSSLKNLTNGNSYSTTDDMMSSLEQIMNSIEDKKAEEECDQNSDGSVDFYQWPSSMSCRLSQTFTNSASSSTTTTTSYTTTKDMRSDILSRANSSDESNSVTDTSVTNSSSTTSSKTYTYDTAFRLDYSTFATKYGEQYRDDYIKNRYNYLNADTKENAKLQEAFSDSEKAVYNTIAQNINIKLTPQSSIDLDNYDDNSQYYIDISSTKDLGSMDIDAAAIGDNCILLEGKDVCKQNYSIKVNPYINESLFRVKLNGKKSGNTLLQFKFCKDGTNVCYYKDYSLSIVSGKVKKIEIDTDTNNMVKGGEIPFKIKALDENSNEIGQLYQTYKVSVDYGTIRIKDTKVKEYEFNRFSDAYFVYDSSDLGNDGDSMNITIKVEPTDDYKAMDNTLPTATKTVTLVRATAKLKSDKDEISKITYQLPDDLETIYDIDKYGKAQLKEDSILKYTLKLDSVHGTPLSSLVSISTKNGFMIPGLVKQKDLTIKKSSKEYTDTQKYFAAKTQYILKGGSLTFYLHPSMSAGDDELIINVDGLGETRIPIKVLPASAVGVVVDTPKTAINVGEDMDVVIRASDVRGNTVDNKTNEIFVGVTGKASFEGSINKKVNTQNGKVTIKVRGEDPGGDVYVYGYLTSKAIDEQIPDYQKITIKNMLWPTTNLNIVYLSLFGNDWGNLRGYFSSNNKFSPDLMANSDKLLAVTTQLVNTDEMKQFQYLIRSDLFINNIETIVSNIKLTDGKIKILFGNTTSPKGDIVIGNVSDFDVTKADTIPSNIDGNKIYYIPEPTDSTITSNLLEKKKVVINGNTVIDFDKSSMDDQIKIVLSESTQNGYNLWEVKYKSKKIGTIVIYRSDDKFISDFYNTFSRNKGNFMSMVIFGEGSTNGKQAIGIYDPDTSMGDTNQSFNSVQNATNTDLNIGFREGFKNMSAFGAGQTVGEATLPYSSEYLINFGDPIIKRISKNENKENTDYDGSLGKTVYTDSNNNILKTVDIDFNNDGYKDLVVAYRDGQVKLLKNYGGNDPFVDVGDVINVADGVKDIWGGDVNGDGFEDLFIQSGDSKIRVYKNKSGIFDTDGTLACLDIYDGDQSTKGAYQIFVEDMDMDKKADIITNDVNGITKITYGDTFLSTNKYYCDESYKSRLKTKIVYDFGLKIEGDRKVYDKSLIHRKGMRKPEVSATDYNDPMSFSGNLYSFTGNTNYQSIDMTMNQYANFVNLTSIDQAKYQSMPLEYLPSYETNYNKSDLYFGYSLYSQQEDQVIAYKKYTDVNGGKLEAGDKVMIDVYFQGNTDTKFTYFEQLDGPWMLLRNDDNSISSFDKGSLSSDATINFSDSDGYNFKIDNATISKGQIQKISYPVYYRGAQLVNIDLTKINDDKYTDIKSYFVDGAYKGYFKALAIDNAADYDISLDSLKDKYEKKINDTWGNFDEYLNGISTNISSTLTGTNEADLDSYNFLEKRDADEALLVFNSGTSSNGESTESTSSTDDSKSKNFVSNTSNNTKGKQSTSSFVDVNSNVDLDNMSIDTDVDIGGQMQGIQNLAEKIQNALCNGIKFDYGNCGGIPVPFNMAFFAPGRYNIFGCGLMKDPGLPIFYYPSTLYMPYPIPVPNMLQSAGDERFMAPTGGIYPSMIRLYLAPTLTQKLGIVACFGTYMVGMDAFPAPIGTIVGNCVVTAVELPVKCNKNKDSKNDYDYTIEGWQNDLKNSGSSSDDLSITGKDTSPFSIQINPSAQTTENAFDLGDISLKMNNYSFAGMTSTSSKTTSLLKTSKTKLNLKDMLDDFSEGGIKNGNGIQLKIEGADVRGIIKCIIKKWLDNQIRYIINNLTNMTIYVYYPDATGVIDGFENLNWDKLADKWENLKKSVGNFKDSIASAFSSDGGSSSSASDYIRKMTPSKAGLKKMSDSLSNPFEMIKDFFDEIPLVNVKTKNVSINVPFIYAEDIERYIQYLEARQDRNLAFLDDLDGESSCKKSFTDPSEIQSCISKFAKIKSNASQLKRSIQKNIDRLYEYKNFPMKLYDYLHGLDKYLTEITKGLKQFVDNTIGWLDKNADRFSKWVDLIETLMGIIDTWQILIEFSVNWKTSCGKCRMDGYDFYSCILSLLCIELPVLPIPPFKIPDIYVDFSHIDIGVNITIPKIKFTPSSIQLPKLPELGDININITLPTIPELPALPDLPDLPDLNFNFDLNLPTLPSPPRIPEIVPAIKTILNIAKRIGKILCIIKGNIGMVAERNTKSRVEQITQRTNRVFPFDFMNITIPKPPLEGKDLRMDTYLKMKFDFNQISDFAEGIADDINSKTSEITKSVSLGGSSGNYSDTNIDINLNLNKSSSGGSNGIQIYNYNDSSNSKSGSGYDIETAKAELKSGLVYMADQETNPSMKQKEKEIVSYLTKPNNVTANVQGIKNAVNAAQNYVLQQKQENQKLQDNIKNNYKEFLENLGNDKLATADQLGEINFKAALFNGDQETIDRISRQPNPSKTYLELNKKLIDGFKKSMNEHDAEYLKMDDSTYAKTKDYMNTVSQKVDTALSYFNETDTNYSYEENDTPSSVYQSTDTPISSLSSTEVASPANLGKGFQDQMLKLADTDNTNDTSNSTDSSTSSSSSTISKYVDMTQYIQGFFAEGSDGYYRNVINRYEKGDDAYENKEYKFSDINGDGKDDILRWDNNNVYIKYADQEDGFKNSDHKLYDDFYEFKTFKSPDAIKSSTDDNGYYSLKGKKYKIWSDTYGLDTFDNNGQTSENISFSWDKGEDQDGYIMKLVQRVDVFNDKDKELKFYGNDMLDKKYILIVPNSFDESGTKVSFDDISKRFAYDLEKNGDIDQIIKKDLTGSSVSITLNDIISKWYYVEVAPMSKDSSNDKLWTKSGPWSMQKTAGPQVWADEQSPTLSLNLVRSKTGKIVSEGTNLKGYINTSYDINANWSDNGVVVECRIEQNGLVIKDAKGGKISLEDKYYTSVQKDKYTFVAKDHAGNVQKEDVVVQIGVPDISIKDITLKKSTGTEITAKLTQDMDDATVIFQRNRYGYWENMTGDSGDAKFDISPDSQTLTGGVFDNSDNIVLKDSNEATIGVIQSDNGNISISKDYQSQISFRLDFSKKVPIIDIVKDGTALYEIYLKGKELAGNNPIKINNGDYELLQLSGNIDDEFKDGYCIKKKMGECVFYIGKTAQFYVPEPYNVQYTGKYTFDKNSNSIIYNIYDNDNNPLFDINYIVEPLTK